MKSFKELKKYFKNENENVKVIEEDEVIIVKNTKVDRETVFFYFNYKNLLNPRYIIDITEKYKSYKYHVILTYVGFSSEVFKEENLDINFDAKININNIEKLSCLGVHQLKMSLLYLKLADIDTYFEILKNIVEKIEKEKKVYGVIPYGFENEQAINADIQKIIKG